MQTMVRQGHARALFFARIAMLAVMMPHLFALSGCDTSAPFVYQPANGAPVEQPAIFRSAADKPKYIENKIIRAIDTSSGNALLDWSAFINRQYGEVRLPAGTYRLTTECESLSGPFSFPRATVKAEAGKTYLLTCTDGSAPLTTQLRVQLITPDQAGPR